MSDLDSTLPCVPDEPQPAGSSLMTIARSQFRRAVAAQQRMLQLWNECSDSDSSTVSSRVLATGIHEAWVRDETPLHIKRQLDEACRHFIFAVKAAMDAAVHEAAHIVSGNLWPIPADQHAMPLCVMTQEFDELLEQGHLAGLRPDQVTELRSLQPFNDAGSPEDAAPYLLLYLRNAIHRASNPAEPLAGTWVSPGPIEYRAPQEASIVEQTLSEAGFLLDERRLGSCLISPSHLAKEISFRSNHRADLAINAAPWPRDSADNLGSRSQGLIVICDAVIRFLLYSVTEEVSSQRLGHLNARFPVIPDSPWLPLSHEDAAYERNTRERLEASETNLGKFRDGQGDLILVRLQRGRLLGRRIPAASPPESTNEGFGADVENVTLAIAAQYALPDFILRPTALRKGAGVREIGDGTILAGNLGLAVQVKARGVEPGDSDGEARWLKKRAKSALQQARGTIRTMTRQSDLELENLRGRRVKIHGNEVTWIPVAVLDHPAPPDDVYFDDALVGPGVVILRRDWEFLWAQLKSARAVVEYIHRIAPSGNVKLGDETGRYYELADADEQAAPAPANVAVALGGTQLHAPKLPQEPAGTHDPLGYEMFRQILEDIAISPFDANERTRIEILALLDRLDVSHRAELGRLLLQRLDQCANVPPSAVMSLNRSFIVEAGQLHLIFSVYSNFTGNIRSAYYTWFKLRRQEYLEAVGAAEGELPWTVGVLLTPRPGRGRPWDTTVSATDSPAAYAAAESARLRLAFARMGLDEPPGA